MTSWEGAHVNVDLLLESLSGVTRKATLVFTRLCGIVFFFFLGWNLFASGGRSLREARGFPHAPCALLSRGVYSGRLRLRRVSRAPVRPHQRHPGGEP